MSNFKILGIILFLIRVVHSESLDDRYHSYGEIVSLIDSLSNVEDYQNIMLVDTIGYSSLENIPIIAVKISDNVTVEVIRGTGIQSLVNTQEIKK